MMGAFFPLEAFPMRSIRSLCLLGFSLLANAAIAEEIAKAEVLAAGLNTPCGIAIQPGTDALFIAESGAGRIVCWNETKAEPVIVGFPLDTYGKGPSYKIGPLGLAFQDRDTLLVGDGGFPDGQEFVRVFTPPATGKAALNYDKDVRHKLGPLPAKEPLKAEGNLFGIVATKSALYVTCNGDDDKGWIAKAEISGSGYGELERSIATKVATGINAPSAIVVNEHSGDLVVGQMGATDRPHDSLLTFYNAKTGKLLMRLPTDLHDLTGLAYSPQTARLYAVDFAWSEAAGGLYRLDAALIEGQQVAKAVRIATLEKPTSLAFDSAGALYVADLGKAGAEPSSSGKVWKFAPGL
jgi:sugar lactone lactonase YvrE